MAKAIAVFVGDEGETADIKQPGKVIIYQKQQGEWLKLREKQFALGEAQGAGELRVGIGEIINFLGDCKIITALSVTGLPYFELEKAGCCVWEITGNPRDFLDYVLAKQEETFEIDAQEGITAPVPEDLGDGCFRLSIKEIQEADMGITSKQALQPILRQGNFSKLEVICRHVPPWLEVETMFGDLMCVTEKLGPGEERVIISKKQGMGNRE